MRLRSAKIRNFQSIATWLGGVETVLFEDLIMQNGLGAKLWIRALTDRWGIPTVKSPIVALANVKKPSEVRTWPWIAMQRSNLDPC